MIVTLQCGSLISGFSPFIVPPTSSSLHDLPPFSSVLCTFVNLENAQDSCISILTTVQKSLRLGAMVCYVLHLFQVVFLLNAWIKSSVGCAWCYQGLQPLCVLRPEGASCGSATMCKANQSKGLIVRRVRPSFS